MSTMVRVGADVVIADVGQFQRKLQRIASEGATNLQLTLDFDRTLTTYHDAHGGVAQVSHGVVTNSGVLPAHISTQCDLLFQHYYPIEKDPTLPESEKIPKMEEWWGEVHRLILSERVTLARVHECARKSALRLRDGVPELLHLAAKASIPVTVLSAGLGDVITSILGARGLALPNVHVVANFLAFDPTSGVATGFKHAVIHTFNKNQHVAERQLNGLYPTVHRSNVLLLGDSLSDVRMVEGDSAHSCVLKVGFLNSSEDALLPQYAAAFDVVLLHDTSMSFVNTLLAHVTGSAASPSLLPPAGLTSYLTLPPLQPAETVAEEVASFA